MLDDRLFVFYVDRERVFDGFVFQLIEDIGDIFQRIDAFRSNVYKVPFFGKNPFDMGKFPWF